MAVTLSLQAGGLSKQPHQERWAGSPRSCLPCLTNVSSLLVTTCWLMTFSSSFLSGKGKAPEIVPSYSDIKTGKKKN